MRPIFYLLLAIYATGLHSQNNLQFLSATTGAACYEVSVHGNYLYAGAGNTLMVFDVGSNVPPFEKTFEYRFSSNIDDIQFKGDKMYVAANHAGISLWSLDDPAEPNLLDQYLPDSLNEAAYHVAFKGDTVFVAYKSKMAFFSDSGDHLTLLGRFGYQSGTSKIRACAVKGNLLAYTAAYGNNAQTGVYLYQAQTLTQLSFFQQNYCDPEGLAFGQTNNLLHIMGGTESLASLGLDPKGLYYSLDVGDPSNPVEVYRDTMPGIIGLAIAMPMNAVNINDTLYVATQSALDVNYQSGDPLSGQIYVYDARNPANVHLITSIYAGLWHFDLAIRNKTLYVASEWYGVKTLDISNLMNETDLGNTLTGGWNTGSDVYGNRLAVANEGYGIKLFDISDPKHPLLLAINNDEGFCFNLDFSPNGQYIYAYYYTGNDFRIFDANTLNELTSIPIGGILPGEYERSAAWGNKAVAYQTVGGNKTLYVMDVSNIAQPAISQSIPFNNITDLLITPGGKLFVATKDSLSVFDLSNNMQRLLTLAPPNNFLQDYTAMAFFQDTLYVYVSGLFGGLFRYTYNGSDQLTAAGSATPAIANPRFMAADEFGLYLCYVKEGLYAFDKHSLTSTGHILHSGEFVHDFLWGPQDLFCKNNLIFLAEYFGQTSIYTNNDFFSETAPSGQNQGRALRVYPNPAGQWISVAAPDAALIKTPLVVYNAAGQVVKSCLPSGQEAILFTGDLPAGCYGISWKGAASFFIKNP